MPTEDDKLISSLTHAILPSIRPLGTTVTEETSLLFTPDLRMAPALAEESAQSDPEKETADTSWVCGKCGNNRRWIDNVRPSHAPDKQFHMLTETFLTAWSLVSLSQYGDERNSTVRMVPTRFEWFTKDNSFRFRPCDFEFKEKWKKYHACNSDLRLLCETCRIEDWVKSINPA